MITGDDTMVVDFVGKNSNMGSPKKVDKFPQESRGSKEGGGVEYMTLIIGNNLSMSSGCNKESSSSYGGTCEDKKEAPSSQVDLSTLSSSNISSPKGNGKNVFNCKRRAQVGNHQTNSNLVSKPKFE